MQIIVIGALTNGKILLDYFKNKKEVKIELIITNPKSLKVPRKVTIKKKDYSNSEIIYDQNANNYINLIKKINPDLIFVIGWSGIINTSILKIPKYGCIGFHPSKLPFDRGRSTLAWQIEEGKKISAYSALFLNSKTDMGDIILQQKFRIKKNDYINDVLNSVDHALKKLLPKIYKMMKKRSFNRIKQNPNKGNYRFLRNDANSLIHWNKNAQDIFNKIRAISKPYPGAFYFLNNKKIKVWKSKILNIKLKKIYMPGEIIKINNNIKSKVIMTKDYPIRIYEK